METKISRRGAPPWNEEAVQRNLQLMKWLRVFLVSFAVDIPVLVLLLQENGLSLAQVMWLQALFAVALALFEVPSGYFADLVSRRAALVVAGYGLVTGAGIYMLATNFWGFLLAEVCLAFAFAFSSGADQALFHDSLLALKREKESTVLWGRIGFAQYVAMAVGAVCGGLIGAWNLRAPLVVTFIGTVCFLLMALRLTEPPRANEGGARSRAGLSDLLTIAVQCLVHEPLVRWLLIGPALIGALLQVGLWMYQPYFKLTAIPVEYFGVLFASFNLAAAFASKSAARIGTRLAPIWLVVIPLLLVALSYLLMGAVVGLFSFTFIIIQQFVRGFTTVYFTDALNKGIGSERRATILSLQSMMQRLVYAVLLVPFGIAADRIGVPLTFLTLAGSTLVLGTLVVLALRPTSVSAEAAELPAD